MTQRHLTLDWVRDAGTTHTIHISIMLRSISLSLSLPLTNAQSPIAPSYIDVEIAKCRNCKMIRTTRESVVTRVVLIKVYTLTGISLTERLRKVSVVDGSAWWQSSSFVRQAGTLGASKINSTPIQHVDNPPRSAMVRSGATKGMFFLKYYYHQLI